MGQQSGYVGAKTQAGTIAQSNLGTAYLYQGFIRFIEKQLAHALNQFKLSLLASDEETTLGVVGTHGMNYIKLTKNLGFEEMGVYIKIKDFIDEQARDRLLMQAQAAMQNQMIDFMDYIKIEQSKTYTEALNELQYSIGRKMREAEKIRQQQQQMAMMQQQQQLAAQAEQAAMREENANFRQDRQLEQQQMQQQQQQQQQLGQE
jgi:hypothetical protein